MTLRRKLWIGAFAVAAIVATWLVTRGLSPPAPNPPGTFSFGVFGDAPYYAWEDLQYRLVLQDLDAHDLAWVVQLGDIFWRPCTDAQYQRSLAWFNGLRHPVIYTPGDNEWTDCWEGGSGRFAPLERLARLRQLFHADPARSLGQRRLALASQAAEPPFADFVENVRWSHHGLTVATVHLVGSFNGLVPFAGRTADHDREVRHRTDAAASWVRSTFAAAHAGASRAVVIVFHANPGLGSPPGHRFRAAFEPFVTTLEEEIDRFDRPVLLVHGDHHEYLVDHPMHSRATGERLDRVTRLEVPGSPDVGWVRVVVALDQPQPFTFESHIVPRWKFW